MAKYLKFGIITAAMVVAAFLLLYQIGGRLISKVTKEVKIEKREDLETALRGKTAPYFELQNLSGEAVKVTDFLESPFVLVFWTTWNHASSDQFKVLDDYVRIKGESLFKVVAIASQEDRSAVSNFISRGGYKLVVLLDESGATTEKYGARNLPATFFINKDGFIKDVAIGIIDEKEILNRVERILK